MTMTIIRYLLALMAPICFAGELGISEKISELLGKKGDFDVCDIQALSDGGTTSICLSVAPGELWVTRRSDTKSTWSAVYEGQQYPAQPVDISDHDITALLHDWVKKRYSCAALSNLQRIELEAFTREDLIAVTLVDLAGMPSECKN